MAAARRAATVQDVLRAEEDGRLVELLAGIIVEKEAASNKHAAAQLAVGGTLFGSFRGRSEDGHPGGWFFASESHVAAPEGDIVMPDIAGWRRERAPSTDEFPTEIAPDWVCEVVYTSHAKDMGYKRGLYHRMGVHHYWILDLKGNVLLVFRRHEVGYIHVDTATPKDQARLEPFDAVELKVWELFGLEDPPEDTPPSGQP